MDEQKTPILTNRLYDVLKYIAQILLPAVGALYFGLAQIWGLPNADEVVGTITVVDTFLGVLLHLSTGQYNREVKYAGSLDVLETGDMKTFTLNVDGNPHDLDQRSEVTFKVNKTTP